MNSKLEHYKCTSCGVRYPETRKTCFYCGKTDTVRYNQITKIEKVKKRYTGPRPNITINRS